MARTFLQPLPSAANPMPALPQAQAVQANPSASNAPASQIASSLCLHALRTDRGRVRQANEDSVAAAPELGAFLVCDGMGGAASGEIASSLTCEHVLKALAASTSAAQTATRRFAEAIRTANQAVYRQAQRSRAHRGMGTTLVGLLVEPPTGTPSTITVAHVGDSRCYRLRAGCLEPLTRDHSLIEEQIQAGLITPAEAATSPIRNIITRAVGSYPAVEPEIAPHAALPGDLFLLASDGLTRELDEPAIAAILASAGARPSQAALDHAAQALIDAANHHGGGDNITVLLLAIL